ncbi:MAG: response regulator [Phycisphaeraceae bacterium]|nr:response regulator [Phycisphaeraceae bacterium]
MTASPRRVLIVEDDPSQRLMYQRALRGMDFESVCVESAAEAHAALRNDQFAIVILDLQLRGELSLDLFEDIRERYPAVSVVIATGHGSFEFARRSIHMDVVDFLAKPIPLSELETALDRAWSRHILVQTPVARLLPPAAAGRPSTTDEGSSPDVAAFLATCPDLSIDAMERELIMEALRRSNDNRKLAADMLGISERKLYYRLTQYRSR